MILIEFLCRPIADRAVSLARERVRAGEEESGVDRFGERVGDGCMLRKRTALDLVEDAGPAEAGAGHAATRAEVDASQGERETSDRAGSWAR